MDRTIDDTRLADFDRLREAIADSFDEELELSMDEETLDAMPHEGGPGQDLDRRLYFRELFRLQRELVRL